MKSFENKVAAITGAGSGIGRTLAYHLARQGCHLALSDVNVEGLQETVEQARKLGVTVSGQRVDVADRAAVERGVEAAVILDGRVPHAILLELFTEHGFGTQILAGVSR